MKEMLFIFLVIFIPAVFVLPTTVFSIEKLSEDEMSSVTAQAGISAAIDDAVVFMDLDSIIVRDVGTRDSSGNLLPAAGYVKFDFKSLMTFDDVLALDVGVLSEDRLSFIDRTASGDVTRSFDHPLNGMAGIFFSHTADSPMTLVDFENIHVYDHATDGEMLLGDIEAGLRIFESEFFLYPPGNGCGFRGTGGARLQVHRLAYENPDQTHGIAISDTMIGASFTGDPLPEAPSDTNQVDTGSWAFGEGIFRVGIPYYFHDDPELEDTEIYSYPFSFDVGRDDARTGDFPTYIKINAPLEGSVRIQNISSGNFDMGPVAIDGMRLYKNVIEFPGRGIGN